VRFQASEKADSWARRPNGQRRRLWRPPTHIVRARNGAHRHLCVSKRAPNTLSASTLTCPKGARGSRAEFPGDSPEEHARPSIVAGKGAIWGSRGLFLGSQREVNKEGVPLLTEAVGGLGVTHPWLLGGGDLDLDVVPGGCCLLAASGALVGVVVGLVGGFGLVSLRLGPRRHLDA
jgi:hypothetical protein